ncbi:MAG: TonB-dependent receptor plug domain-containing protein [Saprospiraceae bacterium]|nr:TonB-dependent receptor plug domain-containing protein [Saprospiraceae bacterium]
MFKLIINFHIVIVLFLSYNLNAQLSGTIVDQNDQPIQDVFLSNLRSGLHTHSDAYGKFVDKSARANDSILLSILGYKKRTIIVESDVQESVSINLEEDNIILEQVNISEPVNENLQKIDTRMNPVQNSQELLRIVPGLFIAQHAGGGKAEQIFLRGFDIDHGTDINITVDNYLPVNMVSHAHGQGYADLHFVIPETVDKVEFEKGSYNVSKGNFATAGSVNFKLKDHLHKSQISLEKGMINFNRAVSLIELKHSKKWDIYGAVEYIRSDGFFESPQDFQKLNGLFKLRYKINYNSGLRFTSSIFSSNWYASGQIPEREVKAGRISRFGAIDDTEGGITSRNNLLIQYYNSGKAYRNFKINAFYTSYSFELFSNFSFFLKDPIHGDQIRQKENRSVIGWESSLEDRFKKSWYQLAVGMRTDLVLSNELSHTFLRTEVLKRKALGDVTENNFYSFAKWHWEHKRLEIQTQLRSDLFTVKYKEKLFNLNQISKHSEFIVSPKLNAFYSVSPKVQFYNKNGFGFHSNDSRLLSKDNNSGLLTRSFNSDLGVQTKPVSNILFHIGYWFIDLEDELVYVGDEAIVESSGHTIRHGLEAGFRSEIGKHFSLFGDASYTIARSAIGSERENFIPLASKWTATAGLNINDMKNFSASIKLRYLGNRPANEDYSIIAYGYTIVDVGVNYNVRNITISGVLDNALNRNWNEAQFATLSRLKNESQPLEELHFTPGNPMNFRLKLGINF